MVSLILTLMIAGLGYRVVFGYLDPSLSLNQRNVTLTLSNLTLLQGIAIYRRALLGDSVTGNMEFESFDELLFILKICNLHSVCGMWAVNILPIS